jgi:hypothetical protein
MKKIHQYLTLGLLLISAHGKAQFIGATAQVGLYAANYTNPSNVKEEVTGKGYLSLGVTYEAKLGENQFSIPVVLNYSRFGTEQTIGESQIMTQNANTINLGLGVKYFFKSDDHTIRPFAAAMASYEALVNSSFYYNAQQAGTLDWGSNAYLGVQAGLGIETGLNARIDIYASFNLGLLNRINSDAFGTYKDQNTCLGVNFIFN